MLTRLPFRHGKTRTSRLYDVSAKRERELARAKYERQHQKRLQRAARAKLRNRIMGGALIALVVVGFAVNQNKSDNKATQAETPAPSASAPVEAKPVVDGCTTPVPTRANNITFQNVPTAKQGSSAITLATNCGDIAFDLDPLAPKTTAIMSFLAQNKYFDATPCHRLTTEGIFVLQCGDPTGQGTGGPGFKFEDENLPQATNGTYVYPRGTVAMANSGANTNGSQFFLVYKDSPLPPNYSVWGKVTKGLDILDSVAKAGVSGGGSDGAPAQAVTIATATAQ